jgi:hypothetical protein
MKPSEKSPEIDNALTCLFGINRKASITRNSCVFCGKVIDPATEFRDECSRREFSISGICQKCQDKTFGV